MRRLLLGAALALAATTQAAGLPADPEVLRQLGQLYASALFRDAYIERCDGDSEPSHIEQLEDLLRRHHGVGLDALRQKLSGQGVDLESSAQEQLEAFLEAVGGCPGAREREFGRQLAGRFRSQREAVFGSAPAAASAEPGPASALAPDGE